MRRAALVILILAAAGCGGQQTSRLATSHSTTTAAATTLAPSAPRVRPQVVEPVAGETSSAASQPSSSAPAAVSVGGSGLAQPVSNTAVEQDLSRSGLSANANQATLTPDGLVIPPIGAPAAVQEVIQAGNQIAHLPYRYGGGHGTYEDTAYDCSGSISFVFEAAHLLKGPVVSGNLMNWGDPGPGKWITIFANAGHTFMYVAGLRFDTVALAETGDRWSTHSANESDLHSFAVRHPPGL